MKTNVHKFGGAFWAQLTNNKARELIPLISRDGEQSIFVCSALGKVTRALEEALKISHASGFENAQDNISQLDKLHLDMIVDLFGSLNTKVRDDFFGDFYNLIDILSHKQNGDETLAKVLQFGELFSSRIFYNYLCKEHGEENVAFVDARTFMKTEPSTGEYPFSQADFDFEESFNLLSNTFSDPEIIGKKFVVTQGYISRDFKSGQETTLGFDGSDFTAIFICMLERVDSVTFWKDVLGVYRDISNLALGYYSDIDFDKYGKIYEESGGGPVLLKAIKFAHERLPKDKKVTMRSFLEPQKEGTSFIF